MKNKTFGKITIVMAALTLAILGCLLWFGIGRDAVKNGGAMITGAWSNLFGVPSADYSIDGNASDTPISSESTTVALQEPDDSIGLAVPGKKPSSTKKTITKN